MKIKNEDIDAKCFFCTKFVLFILFFIVKMEKDKPSLAIALRLNYKKN